jgi:oxygen-independent coproporphyrinogen III oxidase
MYKNRCWMPFILYPPDMYDIGSASEAYDLEKSLALDAQGGDFVMYLSVPFCRVRCKTCPYFVDLLPRNAAAQTDVLDSYLDALLRDLARHAKAPRWAQGRLRGLYVGGGTGSVLDIAQLDRLLDAASTLFELTEDAEITLEGNAEDFTKEKCDFLASSIVNRVSLGAQSFQADILRTVGSPHRIGEMETAVGRLQDAGVEHVQLDMMYNMPGHTIAHWEKDFEVLRRLGVKHLTTYLYRITPGSQQERLIAQGKAPPVLPPESAGVQEMRATIAAFADDVGMRNYMLDHFARPGFESNYNRWTMSECVDALGVGAGAYSFINQRRAGVSEDVARYLAAANDGACAFTTAGLPLTPQLGRQRYIIFNLLYFRIDKAHYRKAWGGEALVDFAATFEALFRDGLTDSPAEIRVTDLGKAWLQNVMLEFFDDGMWENSRALEQQHSSWAMNNHMIDIGAAPKTY